MKQESQAKEPYEDWEDITSQCSTSYFTKANCKILYKDGIVSCRIANQTAIPTEDNTVIFELPSNYTIKQTLWNAPCTDLNIYYLTMKDGYKIAYRHANKNVGTSGMTFNLPVSRT